MFIYIYPYGSKDALITSFSPKAVYFISASEVRKYHSLRKNCLCVVSGGVGHSLQTPTFPPAPRASQSDMPLL